MHLVATKLPNLLKLFTGTIVINRTEKKLCKNKTLTKKHNWLGEKEQQIYLKTLGKYVSLLV